MKPPNIHVNTLLFLMSTKHVYKMEEIFLLFSKRNPRHGRCPSSPRVTKTTPLFSLLFSSVKKAACDDCGSNTLTGSPLLTGEYNHNMGQIQVLLNDLSLLQDYFFSPRILLNYHLNTFKCYCHGLSNNNATTFANYLHQKRWFQWNCWFFSHL